MKYKSLYANCKEAVRKEIRAIWCGSPKNVIQASYKQSIDDLLDEIFAPANAMPIVESMADYKHTTLSSTGYLPLVTPNGMASLWDPALIPYKHQEESWRALNNGQSIVVTTGTGSGKTECFMLPIAKDIIENLPTEGGKVQAVFLYPLNALMEDQKLRLLKVLEGSNARFAIYNGSCPENDAELRNVIRKVINENPNSNEREIAIISAKRILGCSSDIKLSQLACWKAYQNTVSNLPHALTDDEYPQDVVDALSSFTNIVLTREDIRRKNTHPEIILTNSSMIEYALLRTGDYDLFNDSKPLSTARSSGSMKWFAIDETHTYSGAGAVDLAMQIRRVLNAFGSDPNQVRFATSSATIGSGASATAALEDFIEGLTGRKPIVISGDRETIVNCSSPLVGNLYGGNRTYWPLDELIEDGHSIEDKLEILENVIDSYNSNVGNGKKAKVKVHFFFRVLNRGLKVCLSDIDTNTDCFNIHLDVPAHHPSVSSEPYLELARCTSCGEYIAIGQYKEIPGAPYRFRARQQNNENIFSLDNSGTDQGFKTAVFAYLESNQKLVSGSTFITISGDEYSPFRPNSPYSLVINKECRCPYCAASLKNDSDDNENGEINKIRTFRLFPSKINQMISPAVLNQMRQTNGIDPHFGQQYLTFVDSRKDAARSTLDQNLKIEQEFIYQLIYNELVSLKLNNNALLPPKQALAKSLENEITLLVSQKQFGEVAAKSNQLDSVNRDIDLLKTASISFEQVISLLESRNEINLLFEQSIDDNDLLQITQDANASAAEKKLAVEKLKKSFVYGLAYELLAKRHIRGYSPEAMGLFHSTYPIINRISDTAPLPAEIVSYNGAITDPANIIQPKDWRDLLTIALNQERSNESMFIQYDDPNGAFMIDIHSCRRFAMSDSSRRSIRIEPIKSDSKLYPQIVYLLADLLPKTNSGDLRAVIKNNVSLINGVLDAINKTLAREGLAEPGYVINNNNTGWRKEQDENGNDMLRLNVKNIAFRLYDDAHFCKVSGLDDLRPTPVLFKGRSPFFNYGRVELPVASEDWSNSYRNSFASMTDLHNWAATERPVLWNSLWENDGLFASRLDTIYMYDTQKDFYIQAEHTAQIEKSLSRLYQSLFQEHKINILACSTTMEMGVDLGDLELVMMNSVPPSPSNYKQRAGRSGRGRDIFKSAAITLCGSDSLGAKVLRNPYDSLISKPINPPRVILADNERIIQRHLNAYCLRRVLFDYWIPRHPGDNALSFTIRSFYTKFDYEVETPKTPTSRKHKNYAKIKYFGTTNRFCPNTNLPLGDMTQTPYEYFSQWIPQIPLSDCDFILDGFTQDPAVKLSMRNRVDAMFADSCNEAREIAISVGYSFEDYCSSHNPVINLTDFNAIDSDARLAGITRGLSRLLERHLVDYLATSRFTPNADMPVDVIELDINYSTNSWINNGKSNPSYQLKEALSQYSPGNRVVLKNAVYTVGGVSVKGLHRDISDLDFLRHSDMGRVSDRDGVQLSTGESWIRWEGHSDDKLRVLRPYAFLPDYDKDQKSRLSSVGMVRAQLVGVPIWQSNTNPNDLLEVRSSSNAPDSKILYYNDGYGYGFAFCRKCGRAVPEILPFDHRINRDIAGSQINNRLFNAVPGHFGLRLDSKRCSLETDQIDNLARAGKTTILRHAVIGDYLQTDYTEFRFLWPDGSEENNEFFLNAMGVLLCQEFAEYSSIDRGDLDFTITADGHLCIFDAYSGGAGNSDKLSDKTLTDALIDGVSQRLVSALTTTELFDKFTLRYEDHCDFVTAQDWMNAYQAKKASVPATLAYLFPGAVPTTASKFEIESRLMSIGPSAQAILFTDSDYRAWSSFEPASLARIKGISNTYHKLDSLCVVGKTSYMPTDAKQLLVSLHSWNNLSEMSSFPTASIFPLALIDGVLFFSDNRVSANLNDKWGYGVLYKVAYQLGSAPLPLSVTFDPNKDCIFYIDGPATLKIGTKDLYRIIRRKSNFIDRFIAAIPDTESTLDVVYEDQYLKSRLSMIIAIQFIRQLIQEIKTSKPNVKSVKITLETEDYNPRVRDKMDDNSVWMNLTEPTRQIEAENYLDELENQLNSIGITCTTIFRTIPTGDQVHWRELKVSCPACEIIVSPNGGFLNEWKFDAYQNMNEDDDVNTDDNIPLYRKKSIKYDIQLSGSAI